MKNPTEMADATQLTHTKCHVDHRRTSGTDQYTYDRAGSHHNVGAKLRLPPHSRSRPPAAAPEDTVVL